MEGNGQKDDFLLNCRGRWPQVSRKRGGFKEQPLEADGLGTHGWAQGPWAGGFPSRVCSLVSEADRLLISVIAPQRTTCLSQAPGSIPGAGRAECWDG